MLIIRNAQLTDIEQIVHIEKEGFLEEEAATREAFVERIEKISDSFLVAEQYGQVVGYVNGPVIMQPYITDDLFTTIEANPATGGYQSILGLAVAKEARNQGIATQLLKQLEQQVIAQAREGITLTCKKELVDFYEQLGFENHGLSTSQHGGVRWFNFIKLKEQME